MKHLIISLIILIFSITLVAKAEEGNSIARLPGKVKCMDKIKVCQYVAQNLRARDLVARINKVMFPGTVLSPNEGYINVETLKKVNFWFENEELKDRFIALIPIMDSYEDFVPAGLVQLTTEIFSLSESAMLNLEASLSSASSDAGDAPDWSITTGNGAMDLALKVGTNLLSSALGSSSVKKESKRMTKVTQLIPNLSGINYNHTTNVFVSPTSGIVKDELAGITIGGTVSISKADSDLIVIKDYSFRYGLLKQGGEGEIDKVSVLNVTTPELYMIKGTSSMIVSSVTTEQGTGREGGLLRIGRSKDSLQSKVMVVTRARSISFHEYIRELKEERSRSGLHGTFSKETLEALPSGGSDVKAAISKLLPFSYFTTSGERKLGFWLDRKLATKGNYDKSVEISVKGGGIKFKKVLTLENLMTTGIHFPELNHNELNKPYVKIKVSIKEFRGGFGSSVKTKLYYNPETNQFIK